MRHYRRVQYHIRNRRGLARWIRLRLVARCPTKRKPKGSRRAAALACEITPQLLTLLCLRRKSRMEVETVQRLEYGAVKLRAEGESASQILGELHALLEAPAPAELLHYRQDAARRGGFRPPERLIAYRNLTEGQRARLHSAKEPTLRADAWIEIPRRDEKILIPRLIRRYGRGLLLMRQPVRSPTGALPGSAEVRAVRAAPPGARRKALRDLLERFPGIRQGWTGVASGGRRGALYASFFRVP